MSSTPIATTAARARERLAASLAALQQDNNVPSGVMDVVQGIARAIGPLFQLEKGGDAALLFNARTALQETLAGMQQSTDQNHPAVADATAAIAQSLGMLFAAIREHGLTEPGGPRRLRPCRRSRRSPRRPWRRSRRSPWRPRWRRCTQRPWRRPRWPRRCRWQNSHINLPRRAPLHRP
jgi:hypothetical protein